jgi:hypothetical protein
LFDYEILQNEKIHKKINFFPLCAYEDVSKLRTKGDSPQTPIRGRFLEACNFEKPPL